MKIIYNQDKTLELEKELSVMEFLKLQNINTQGVAVAVDEKIVKKADFESFILKDGMCIDVYNMVSGG